MLWEILIHSRKIYRYFLQCIVINIVSPNGFNWVEIKRNHPLIITIITVHFILTLQINKNWNVWPKNSFSSFGDIFSTKQVKRSKREFLFEVCSSQYLKISKIHTGLKISKMNMISFIMCPGFIKNIQSYFYIST